MLFTTTNDEINDYLNGIKELINKNENNLIVSSNRDINLSFMIKYGLKKKKIIQIINSLHKSDFIKKVINEHVNFSSEILYIFSKTINLEDIDGKIKKVTIYIKFNFLDEKVILISFHEAKYKFKENK